jgi:competence ComEA-like helix-hairpin-helix protein
LSVGFFTTDNSIQSIHEDLHMRFSNLMLALVLALFSTVTFAQAININTASAEEMEKGLVGIGPSKAADIVKYRETHGPFQSVNDLTKVPGIKGKALESLLADKRNQLTVGDVAAPTMPATPAPKPPVTSSAPATPATPAVPATPATPAVPATPATPAVPATPATPAAPATEPPKQ